MEIVTAIVTPVVQSLMVPVKKHLGYLFFCKKYVRDMGTKRKDLDDKRVNVEDPKNHNERNIFVVPAEVDGWLKKVRDLEEKVAIISDDVGSCFNITRRHKLGRKAFKIIEEINSLIQENDMINWTDRRIPPAKVNFKNASTSTPSSHHNDFPSRERTFMEALEQLQPDHKTRMIALCGMGGVGKTTMMENLKKAAEEKKLFNMIVKVAIGEKTDPIVIQQSVADFLGIDLKESDKGARAINLQKSFEATSDGGKKKILVILDDVWEFLDLNDIGLSPLPNQGVGFKILLTSRIQDVCSSMEVDSIFDVKTIEDHEAQSFFHQCVKAPNGGDLDFNLHEIGNDIANRCHGLPIAIKTIAKFLKSYRSDKWVWENTLSSLKNKKVEEAVYKIFEISYNHLQDEEIRSTLLLCGVFPEDFDTPREDLVRYGWGLRLFNNVHTIREARNRVNTYIEQLINANLLIRSQLVNHVKMHDLVRSFVLKICSNSEHASYIGDISKWSEENTSEICKRISLTCTGMSEFPRNFKFPNLSLLKLMHGDKSLKFPEDFYEDMNKLQVIAYDQIEYQLLLRSLACSNLRTLCLYRCSLMFDFSSIGNLSNLEVLSLADCSVRRLPSTIGNLKELKLLDLTGCIDLNIDDGVLKNLIKIEEFYVKVGSPGMYDHDKKAIRFTDSICNELAELSKNLFALEIEFVDNNALPKNMSFKKLERFKISLGCYLNDDVGQNSQSYENTLMLVTEKSELLDFRINELFEKTEVLRLQVNGVNNLGDGLVESSCHQRSPFYNLRVLEIRKCENLSYLFTVCVANGLTKLERLTVLSCPVLETLVKGGSGELGVIKFQVLKFLSLGKLPELTSLCNVVNVIKFPQLEELILDSLPNFTSVYPDYSKSATSSMSNDISTTQPFLNKEVVIPKLEKLHISNMENLKEIWVCEFSTSEEVNDCILRDVRVKGCDSVVNLFPSNPLPLLNHLEELQVSYCGSIEVLFNIDLRRVGKNEEVGSRLRTFRVRRLENLREVWRIKGANDAGDHVINGFQAIERIVIEECKRFRNVFTPTTTNFDLRALTKLTINDCGESERADEMVNSRQEQEINVAFPSYLIHTFHNLHNLSINNYRRAEVEVVFEIETPSSRELATTPQSNQQSPRLCYLKDLELEHMERMSHVWKCNWNKFLISQKQQPQSSSSFHNLTTIWLYECKNIKYLFSPLMAKLLSNLKEIHMRNCDVIEEVVSNRDDEDEELVASTSTNTSFPYLDTLILYRLPNLKCIGGASGAKGGSKEITSIHDQSKIPRVNDVAWSLCQYARKIYIRDCEALPYVIPSYARGQMQMFENLKIGYCKSLVEVFESQGFNIGKGSGGNDATIVIPGMKIINVPQLFNLKDLYVTNCDLMQYVFTFSTLESLRQLERLSIRKCKAMKVIVKEDNGEQTTTISSKVVLFPRLKYIDLEDLPNLAGFFLGMDEFQLPLLDFVMINACPQMMVFTSGRSIAPKLNYIHTKLGKHSLECGLNFTVTTATLHKSPFSSLDTTNSCATTSKGTPWSFRNLIEIEVEYNRDVKKIIPSNEWLQLQKLEKIHVVRCNLVEEVFEALEGTNSSELQSVVVVEIPKLREVELKRLKNLKYIWKNNPWMVLEFPNLTKLSIKGCHRLQHVFSSSMVGSLLQLQDLHIRGCRKIEVIVKEADVVVEEEGDEEEECDDKVNNEIIIMLPRLKSLMLDNLPSLKGFYLGKEAFSLPSLDTLEIKKCGAIRVFTKGDLATPELKVIDTSFGRFELGREEEDLNSFINTKLKQVMQFYSEDKDEDEDEQEDEDE